MPVYFKKNIDKDSVLALWRITERVDELLAWQNLRPLERELYNSFRTDTRRRHWLSYRALLKNLLHPEDIPVEYNENGKPYLAGSHLHISVTHTADYSGVIISGKAVGIDMEMVRPRIERVADKFLSPEEMQMINEEHKLDLMTRAWCAKEALYKLFNRKEMDFRKNLRTDLSGGTEAQSFDAEITLGNFHKHFRMVREMIGDIMLVYTMDDGL